MKRNNAVSESEIVESLLAEAPDDLKQRVRQATREDQRAEAVHDQWSQIIQTLQSEQQVYVSRQERVIAKVTARLTDEATVSVTATGKKSAARQFNRKTRPVRPSWRLLATAACVAISTGYFAVSFFGLAHQAQAPNTAENIKVADSTRAESSAQYVAFGWTGAQAGTLSQPFSSLDKGIASLSSGGMLHIKTGSTGETVKIAKPVTLVAVGGNVRIGAP